MTIPADEDLKALAEAFDRFTRRYKLTEALRSDTPLGELDKHVLVRIAREPDSGPGDIARFLGLPATTLSSAVDRLVRRGLIARERHPADRRAVTLALTPAGRARVDALLAGYEQLHRAMLEPLTAEERRQLVAIMQKIVAATVD
jgi:DNA-binding MarR family transcriptional regulator